LVKTFSDDKRVTYFVYELKNVLVTSYSISGSGETDVPVESFSLNFEKIKWTYDEFDDSGNFIDSVEATWEVKKGE